jgi:Ca2+-binding EF-hand superfamily protein
MRPSVSWLLLGLIALLPAAAHAAFPPAAEIKAAFKALDKSRNDAISADEWDQASFALFRAADKNNDNFLDPAEIAPGTAVPSTFFRADADRDGRLSVGEFMTLRRAIFNAADIDRDETLTFVEYELLRLLVEAGWTDTNKDGRIQISELRASLAKVFEQCDADHDGALTPAEAYFMQPGDFAAADTNHDGKLTLDELVAGYRRRLGA